MHSEEDGRAPGADIVGLIYPWKSKKMEELKKIDKGVAARKGAD